MGGGLGKGIKGGGEACGKGRVYCVWRGATWFGA